VLTGPSSTSRHEQSKAEGEELVREAFPEAAIVRPSAIFGYEDRVCNLVASASRVAPLEVRRAIRD
jgi:dTDP-4-dehydrorhamnose reductase